MAYCPECGSEVAQHDVFCAYCGFALPNVAEQPEVKEIATEQSPTSDLVKTASSSELIQNDLAPFSLSEESENRLEDSIPAPVILQETSVSEESYSENDDPIIEESKYSDELISVVENESKEDEIPETPLVLSEEKIEINNAEADENEESIIEPEISQESIKVVPIIETKTSVENLADDFVDEEIDTPVSEIEKEVESVSLIQEDDFEHTIPDNYEMKQELNSDEIDTSVPSLAEIDEEDKLKSVLDEIDLNLQSQNEISSEKSTEPVQEEGVVIPTAANLQAEVFSVQSQQDEIISPSASNYASAIQAKMEEDYSSPVLEEKVEFSPFVEKVETPEPEELKNVEEDSAGLIDKAEDLDEPPTLLAQEINIPNEKPIEEVISTLPKVESEEKEGRAFTNPNIGVSDTDGRNKTKLKPLDEGTVLNNRYEIVRKIGGGGMGAVYLATDKNLGGVLRAVKEMVQSYIEDDQQVKAVNDFKRESLLLTSLEHPSIPTIYDYFFDEKEARFYLVMKYISGGDLAARLRSAPEGRIDEVSVTDWAIQITDVLDYLHNRQPPIVYRDLKPSNIMIDGNTGKLMIIDFGIARWVNKEEKGVTAVGTMGYAPPELFSGNVEPRSDIYSLGSTMFHLLTGADPQSNPLLIFDFNKNPKPRQINSQLSDQMEQILMQAVEYNSTQRFNSALEMREALLQHMENLKKGAVTFGVINTSPGSPINANVPVFCGFCGQKIVATDMFCPFCGAQQPLAAQSKKLSSAPVYAAPTLFPRLMIVGTNDLETMDYILEKDSNLLGRRDPMSNIFPEVDLSKFDPQTKISRKHARIWREGDVYMLEDLGSSNGTTLISILNGSTRLLPRQPQVLSHGDKVKLGDTILRFTIG